MDTAYPSQGHPAASSGAAEVSATSPAADEAAPKMVTSVPDLICILESGSGINRGGGGSGSAQATEDLRYGLRVAVVVLPAHPLLRTVEALRVVEPRHSAMRTCTTARWAHTASLSLCPMDQVVV